MLRIPLIFVVSGVGLLSLAVTLANSTRDFIGGSLLAEGTVVRAERQFDGAPAASHGSGKQRYVYAIWFPTRSGKTVAIRRAIGDATPYFRPGETVPILYDPDAPGATARVATFGNLWGRPLFAGIAGAACLVLAGWLLPKRKRAGTGAD